jgi:hypothetical protein
VSRRRVDSRGDFGFEFTTLPEYLREHGWEDEDGMASIPG